MIVGSDVSDLADSSGEVGGVGSTSLIVGGDVSAMASLNDRYSITEQMCLC